MEEKAGAGEDHLWNREAEGEQREGEREGWETPTI